MKIPPAHRRLVPRTPRPETDDLDVTAKRVVPPSPPTPPPTPNPNDSMYEQTIVRISDADFDSTDRRHIPAAELLQQVEPPADDLAPPPPSGLTSLADLEPTTLHAPSPNGIEDRPAVHLSPAEYGLVAAIAEGHEPSRLRYAEWLERRGEIVRAEFLRLDHALHAMRADDPQFTRTYVRLRELASRISVDWRSRVSRASIEACTAYGVTCPRYWRALPAGADEARVCGACHENVYFCVTTQHAQDLVHHGQRVALDLTCDRWPNDLDRQCERCSGGVPAHHRFCPHCGQAMPGVR